ncbi:hypothetical protein GCM10028808_73110 [Spirosoma migulaei]
MDLSPYPLVRVEQGDDIVYIFYTNQDVQYKIVFKPDNTYLQNDNPVSFLTFSFILTRLDEKVAVVDPRIKATVVYAIRAALEANPHLVITYQCSSVDKKQRARNKMFGSWFAENGSGYCHLDYSNEADAYVTAIFREEHPMKELIGETFGEVFYQK